MSGVAIVTIPIVFYEGVVGVPLPLVSYGGTAMLTVLIGFGLLLSVDIHRYTTISRFPVDL